MKEKYLPIGTVVLLKDATKKLMITGYCSMLPTDQTKIYDYVGILFPEGNVAGEDVALFDHEQIAVVEHMGLENQEYKEFNSNLIKVMEEEMTSKEKMTSNEEQFIPLGFDSVYDIIKDLPIEELKKQVSEPVPFDVGSVKIPSLDIKNSKSITAIRPSIGEPQEEVDVTLVADDSDDESPVLQLEPIFIDKNINNDDADDSSNTTTGIFELERL